MHTFALLALTVPLAAPAIKDRKAGLDLTGEWVVAEYVLGGQPVPAGVRVEFAAGGSAVFVNPKGERTEGTYTADPAKAPAEIDITFPDQAAAPMIGICKAAKDRLIICFADKDRPHKFESPAGSGVGLLTLRRVHKKD